MREKDKSTIFLVSSAMFIVIYQFVLVKLLVIDKTFTLDFFDLMVLFAFIPLGVVVIFFIILNSQKLVKGGISEDE